MSFFKLLLKAVIVIIYKLQYGSIIKNERVFLMKSIFLSQVRGILTFVVVLGVLFMILVGCSSKSDSAPQTTNKYTNLPGSEIASFEGSAYIAAGRRPVSDNDDDSGVMVWSDVTNLALYLPKDHPQYDTFRTMLTRSSKDDFNIVKIIVKIDVDDENGYPVIGVEKLSPEREKKLLDRYKSVDVYHHL